MVYFPPITLFQWHTRVYEEIFDSSNNTKYLKFYCQKFEPTGIGKLWRLTLRFHTLIWISGPKVWSPLDYPRELTPLYMHKFPDSNCIKRTFLDKFPPMCLKFYWRKFEPTGIGKLWRLALRFHTLIWISGPKVWSPLDYPRELTPLYMHKFPDSNCIKRTFLDKFPPMWFATTWQGGHVGGQNSRIFFSKNLHDCCDVSCKPVIWIQ